MVDLFKEFLPYLMYHRNSPFETEEEIDKFYEKNSYIINKSLSMHSDCVYFANEMNIHHTLPGNMKNDFFLNTIRGYKRPHFYSKKSKLADLDIVKEYYNVSNEKGKYYLSLLTEDNLKTIKKLLDKGGKKR